MPWITPLAESCGGEPGIDRLYLAPNSQFWDYVEGTCSLLMRRAHSVRGFFYSNPQEGLRQVSPASLKIASDSWAGLRLARAITSLGLKTSLYSFGSGGGLGFISLTLSVSAVEAGLRLIVLVPLTVALRL